MPSSKPMLPGSYPPHWEAAASYLAVRWEWKEDGEVTIERALSTPRHNTLSTKARAMRISMTKFPAWGPLLHEFAKAGGLSIIPRKGQFGLEIVLQVRHRVQIDFDKVRTAG